MPYQRVLHLDRRDPFSADFEHVVGAAFVPEKAVFIHSITVARRYPVALHRATAFFALMPVKRGGAGPFHEQIAGCADGRRPSIVVKDAQLISWHWLAARARFVGLRSVRAEDVQ